MNRLKRETSLEDVIRSKTRRCGSVYLGVVVLQVRYFEHALLQLKNCHHILPERTKPLLHLFAEPHSLYSMSQSTTKIVSFRDNVWKYAHLQCRHAWSQIKTLLHGFKRSWFVICGFRSVLCVSLFQDSLLLIVIMIDGSDKHNCEGGFWTLEFACLWKAQ